MNNHQGHHHNMTSSMNHGDTMSSTPMDHSGHMMGAAEPEPNVHNAHAGGGGHTMKMYFHFGYDEPNVLFSFWTITTLEGLIGSCVGIFILGLLYEGIKWFRLFLDNRCGPRSRQQRRGDQAPLADNPNGQNQLTNDDTHSVSIGQVVRRSFPWFHFLQTFLYMVQFVVSYFLMLIFMTFNVWLCVAVTLGSTVGHFLFAKRNLAEPLLGDHCH